MATQKMQPTAQATFEQMLVAKLRPHPKNVRARAVADEEMVASVATQGIHQPLVVAPHPTLQGDYTVIMGHRRLAAARKAGLDVVPVLVRHDLLDERDQIAAMVQENVHRQDLSITEEADAVQTMLDFDGWDAKRVARETGLSARRVRSRAKLTRLPDAAYEKLQIGQLTLERAEALADFAGDPEEEQLLEVLDTHPTNWEWHLKRAKTAREWRKRRPKVVAEMVAAGVPVVQAPDEPLWSSEQPWQEVQFETAEEAKAAGASVIVHEHSDDVVYVVPRPVREQSVEDEARAARRALTAELDAQLADVVGLEDEWIRSTVLPAVKAGDERTLRVLARYHHQATYGAGGTNEFPAMARVLQLGEISGPVPEAVGEALQGRSLVEQAALWLLCRSRPFYLGFNCYVQPRGVAMTWFELRHALGWEWTEPEARAIRELGAADPLASEADTGAAAGGEL